LLLLGIILLILGALLDIGFLFTIGVILAVIGLVLLLVGSLTATRIGGRRHWW
jgi:hypothetical protein